MVYQLSKKVKHSDFAVEEWSSELHNIVFAK